MIVDAAPIFQQNVHGNWSGIVEFGPEIERDPIYGEVMRALQRSHNDRMAQNPMWTGSAFKYEDDFRGNPKELAGYLTVELRRYFDTMTEVKDHKIEELEWEIIDLQEEIEMLGEPDGL